MVRPAASKASARLSSKPMKRERSPKSPSSSSNTAPYISLRRTTRSIASTDVAGSLSVPASATGMSTRKLDISKYAYAPATPPRKKAKIESHDLDTSTPLTPLTPLSTIANPNIKVEDGTGTPASASKKAKSKPMPLLALDKPHPAPARWEEQYRLIERMRKGIIAPVDDMGCERPRTTTDAEPKVLRFHILISLMLSSQTKDPVTSQAVTNLHQTLPGGLTAESLYSAPLETVHECINKVGFWRRKAEYIQDAARVLLDKEGEERGDVPKTLEGLCALKGVGPKMAFLALQCAWDINAGIGVDVHVHRITNRLKWHKPPTTNPEQTRLNLQSWLPSELHKPINPMMVGFGQVICLPIGPRCDLCLLGQKRVCPSRVGNVRSEGRKEVVYTFVHDDEDVGGEIKAEAGAKVEVGYDLSDTRDLEKIKDEPEGDIGVKTESDSRPTLDAALEEPGMRVVDEVLDVLDQVDGAREIGAATVKSEVDW